MRQKCLLYMALAASLCYILLRNTPVDVTIGSVPGPVPSFYQQAFLKQCDRSALGYFYSFQLIHSGDLHGQRTPIGAYNFNQVIAWLNFLHTLLPQSEVAPFLATFYFSNTRSPKAIYQLIIFLKNYSKRDLEARWRWYTYGIYLAHRLSDFTYAYQLAVELSAENISTLPLWVKDMPGFLLMKMKRTKQAQTFFQNLLKSAKNLSKEETSFLQYRLKLLAD